MELHQHAPRLTTQQEAEQLFAASSVLRQETDTQARTIAGAIIIRLSLQAGQPSIRTKAAALLREQYGAEVADQAMMLAANAAS